MINTISQIRTNSHSYSLVKKEQQCFDLVHRFAIGKVDLHKFQQSIFHDWAEQREQLWLAAQQHAGRDFRPLARLLDATYAECRSSVEPERTWEKFRQWLAEYRSFGSPRAPVDGVCQPHHIRFFERPLQGKWVYPCSLDDIRRQLLNVPEQDLEGIESIALAPHDRKGRTAIGLYIYRSRRYKPPLVVLPAWPVSLGYKLNRRHSQGFLDDWYRTELVYGMKLEQANSCRISTRWQPGCLRQYITEHVLLHEIGHHVQDRWRWRAGLSVESLSKSASEHFAEDYALRNKRHTETHPHDAARVETMPLMNHLRHAFRAGEQYSS